jgi:hypothetical protein
MASMLLAGVKSETALAGANPPPPIPNVSAADAYREVVPTSGGVKDVQATPKAGHVSERLRNVLETQAGNDAAALERITSSPSYGAPSRRVGNTQLVPNPRPKGTSAARASSSDTSNEGPLFVAISAAGIAIAGVGAAVLKRRSAAAAGLTNR